MKIKKVIALMSILVTAGLIYAWSPVTENKLVDLHRGDSWSYKFIDLDYLTNQPVDLTDYIIKFRVKENKSDTTYVVDKTCTLSDPENGITILQLSTSDTDLSPKEYYAYVVRTNLAGTVYRTLLKSTLTIVE